MTMPRKTENSVRYARLATRGVLTRLALMFNASAHKTFTGTEVAEILVRAVTAAGSPEERAELAGDPPSPGAQA